MQPFGQVFLSNRSSAAPYHFDPLIHEENDGGVSAEKEALALVEAEKAAALEEETRQKEALALVEAEKAAALEEETRQKEALALVEAEKAASGARKRKKQEQSDKERLALAVEMEKEAVALEEAEKAATLRFFYSKGGAAISPPGIKTDISPTRIKDQNI